ncbi:hypothetical protein ACIBF6_14410 [Streptosporangium amethystogenes]|uniref:hypothetical protein n=1 Tax=Streptosporangium amethystogenes TaxID=2002 RepID=UPI0037BA2667
MWQWWMPCTVPCRVVTWGPRSGAAALSEDSAEVALLNSAVTGMIVRIPLSTVSCFRGGRMRDAAVPVTT